MTTSTLTRTVLTVDPAALHRALTAVLRVGDHHSVPADQQRLRLLVERDALVIEATDGTVFIRTFTPLTDTRPDAPVEPVMIRTWAAAMLVMGRALDEGTPTIAMPTPDEPEVILSGGPYVLHEPVLAKDPRFADLAAALPRSVKADEGAPSVTALNPGVLRLLADLASISTSAQPILFGRTRRASDPLVFTQTASLSDTRPWLVGVAGMNRTRRHTISTVR